MGLISIIIPVYNEQDCLPALMDRLLAVQSAGGQEFEFIFVDDGSTDSSREIILDIARKNENIAYLFFSRNFGHEAATSAGIDHASGDAVVIIDSDLQDPPEVIPLLVEQWLAGNKVVYAQRRKRKGETLLKRSTSWLFYRFIRRLSKVDIPPDTGDFRLMDRCVVENFRHCREANRFVRGLIAWVGFKSTSVLYDRDKRMAGQTKYNMWKLAVLAMDAVVGFSNVPLRMGMLLGFMACLAALLMVGYVVFYRLVWGIPIPGYAMLTAGMFFLGGVQLCVMGLMAEYIGRIHRETQDRPLYIVAEKSPLLPPGRYGWHSVDPESARQGRVSTVDATMPARGVAAANAQAPEGTKK